MCDFIAFAGEGIFRFYYLDDGNEKVTAFFPGNFVTNYRSFLTGRASDHYIEANQDALIYKMHTADLRTLYDRHPAIERLGRLIAENLYLTAEKCMDRHDYSYLGTTDLLDVHSS